MPLTSKVLENIMANTSSGYNLLNFTGYNVLGESTSGNLIPFLTGLSLKQMLASNT